MYNEVISLMWGFGLTRNGRQLPTDLQPSSSEDGDDLGLHIRYGDGAEVTAVFGLGAVVAQDEDVAFRYPVGVLPAPLWRRWGTGSRRTG